MMWRKNITTEPDDDRFFYDMVVESRKKQAQTRKELEERVAPIMQRHGVPESAWRDLSNTTLIDYILKYGDTENAEQ